MTSSLGDTKAPNKMEAGSVYNLIEGLCPDELSKDKVIASPKLIINKTATDIIDNALTLTSKWKAEKQSKLHE